MGLFKIGAIAVWVAFAAFSLLIDRNEFHWMVSEETDPSRLPADDAQGVKEAFSLVGLAVVILTQGMLAVRADNGFARVMPVCLGLLSIVIWYAFFWMQ